MHIAVVGAGAAGLVAATHLVRDGHDVVVLEANDRVGGRIETVSLAPGWHVDVGAHAFGADCAHLRETCEGSTFEFFSKWPWNLPDLVVGTMRYAPLYADTGSRAPVAADWQDRLDAWIKGFPPCQYEPVPDNAEAANALRAAIGEDATRYLHATIEHAIGWPFGDLSAAYVRSLMIYTPAQRLGQFAEGLGTAMDRLAARLHVETGVRVTAVKPGRVEPYGPVDGVVVAVPAPVAAALVPQGSPGRPDWIDDVAYSSEVAVTAFREWTAPSRWMDGVRVDEDHGIGRVAITNAGQWFTPEGWQGAVIAASRRLSAELVARRASDAEVLDELWQLGRAFDERLFERADVRKYVVTRHEFAWPRWSAEHATRVARWRQQPPIVFAGDWAWHPFVEGAVRSGERAAAVFRSA